MTPGLVDCFVIATLNEKSLYLMHYLIFLFDRRIRERWLQREEEADAVGPLIEGEVFFLKDRLFSLYFLRGYQAFPFEFFLILLYLFPRRKQEGL